VLNFAMRPAIAVIAGALLYAAPDRAASINKSEYVTVDGARLYLLIRGANRNAPILLWLHGGPGGAERPLFRYFNGDLEKHFTVVYWDQRGAGRSFDPDADPHQLTIARHIADLDRVVDHLKNTLHQDRIALVGHSWGGALGLLYVHAHPHKVSVIVAVNPAVSTRAAAQAEYEFVLREASRRHDSKGLRTIHKIGSPPYKKADQGLAIGRLCEKYGGAFHKRPHRMWIMVRAIASGLVTPWGIPRLIHANNVTLEAMNDELLRLDLTRSVPSVDVPALFFLGRYDRHADATISAAYVKQLKAPVKRLIWFEHSAHNVPFEEPKLFNETLTRELGRVGFSPQ
jgi:pimeloyl-ACP methyl ester carboxylesterase